MNKKLQHLTMAFLALPLTVGGVAVAATPALAATATTCTGVLAGGKARVSGDVVVPSGGNCNIQGQKVTGGVTVEPGGTLIIGGGSTIAGGVVSKGAGSASIDLGTGTFNYSVLICNSTIGGSVSATGSTSEVLIGGDACGGNTIRGGVTVSNNTGGVEVSSNKVGGSIIANGNSGQTADDPDVAVEISANKIGGGLNCSGNTSVDQTQATNTAAGPKTGQCASL